MENSDPFKVLIIGGGLGGLCLAQGLKKAGIDCHVFERDTSPTSRLQGYRLSMNPAGLRALHTNLPQSLWNQIDANLNPQTEGISFINQQLEPRFFKKTPDPVDAVHRFGSISRVRLREILLSELASQVSFNKKFTYYEGRANGKVRCFFDDETWTEGDLVVGADGTKSPVRRQLLPGSARTETGVSTIAGQVVLDEQTQQDYLPAPIGESAVVLDSKPQGLFLARHELSGHQNGDNYIFWSFLTDRVNFPDNLETLSPPALIDLVDRMTAGWHERLKRLINRADPQTVLVLSYKTSQAPARWPSGPVTVLGDAVHSMPPTSGEGANTALQDAAVLCRSLMTYRAGKSTLTQAIEHYETRMLTYAFQAVDNAMVNLRRMVVRADR